MFAFDGYFLAVKDSLLSLFSCRSVSKKTGIVCFINRAIDKNMKCKRHPNGCGDFIAQGTPVIVDATECELVQGCIYYIAVRVLGHIEDKKGEWQPHKMCKIGYLKCLYNQVHLFAHRVGFISKIELPEEDNETYLARNVCEGIARIRFTDTGLLTYAEFKKEE